MPTSSVICIRYNVFGLGLTEYWDTYLQCHMRERYDHHACKLALSYRVAAELYAHKVTYPVDGDRLLLGIQKHHYLYRNACYAV